MMQWYRVLEQLLMTVCAGVCSCYSIKASCCAVLNIQQNSFNSVNGSGSPYSPPLEEGSPKTGSFAVYQKKSSIVKQAYLRGVSEKDSKSVHTSTIVVSPDPLSPPLTSSAVKTPENAEEDPNDPELAD
jgi:hypothetical protein